MRGVAVPIGGFLLASAALAAPGTRPAQDSDRSALHWTLGAWEGVRRDGADGTEAPMTCRVEAILGGAGFAEHLEVRHDKGVYRGYAVAALDRDAGRWVRQYVNDVKGRFVRQEGSPDGDRITWRSVSPERKQESRMVSERIGAEGWRRTQSYSDDGGKTWKVRFVDELRRTR